MDQTGDQGKEGGVKSHCDVKAERLEETSPSNDPIYILSLKCCVRSTE